MPDQEDAKDFDSVADALLDKVEIETPTDSSPENKPEDEAGKAEVTPTAEVDKTEKVKEVEQDSSLSVEEKLAKVKEILGEDEKAIDAYIKIKGYHNDPAWQKQRELIEKLRKESAVKSALSDEDKLALDDFKKFRSTPEYIRDSMKSQGYTPEAIDKKLKESGFEVQVKPQDDVNLVVEKLGLKLDDMSPQDKAGVLANISDVVKIAEILIDDRFSKVLPKELGPIQDVIKKNEQSARGSQLTNSMRDIVKKEGILDFEKDIEPALNKFMDDYPDCIQQDVFDHFKTIHHNLTVERLKTGKKKEERDDKRGILRQNIPLSGTKNMPKKSGNFDADADAFFESVNFTE